MRRTFLVLVLLTLANPGRCAPNPEGPIGTCWLDMNGALGLTSVPSPAIYFGGRPPGDRVHLLGAELGYVWSETVTARAGFKWTLNRADLTDDTATGRTERIIVSENNLQLTFGLRIYIGGGNRNDRPIDGGTPFPDHGDR